MPVPQPRWAPARHPPNRPARLSADTLNYIHATEIRAVEQTLKKAKAGAGCAAMVWGLGAQAGGLDRTGQDLGPLFEKGHHLSTETYTVQPRVRGTDALGKSTGQVADDYSQWGFAYRRDLNSRSSLLIMVSKPFGLDIAYSPQQSPLFGGTQARVNSHELLGVLRYRWDEHWAVHGGLRLQRTDGHVALGGLVFGALNGYRVDFRPSTEPGYLLGMSYERPDMTLRIAATYYSAIKHRIATRENLWPGETRTASTAPQSLNLDIQTGITPGTVLFGQIRWTDWSQFRLRPQTLEAVLPGRSLADMQDTMTYTLGLGQRLAENWSGFVAVAYDERSDKAALSPLRPTNGRIGYTVGVSYQQGRFKLTPWLSYQRLGSTDISSGGTTLATFDAESATAVGIRLGYQF